MSSIRTEFEFVLPRGYMDAEGNLHREGVMRLATAADEILPLKDPRVQSNATYKAWLKNVPQAADAVAALGAAQPELATQNLNAVKTVFNKYLQTAFNGSQSPKDAMDAGASGVAYGRFVWDRKNTANFINALKVIIHKNGDVKTAMQVLRGK